MEEKIVTGDGSASAAATTPVSYQTSIYCEPAALPGYVVEAIKGIESQLEMPVFALIQHDDRRFEELDWELTDAVLTDIRKIPKGKPIALLVHSPGGYANCAFKLAHGINRHCGSFLVVVPRWAKSAATLLALGASRIILGSQGELGPLDAQVSDAEREQDLSALDEVQALERLSAFALEVADRTMFLLKRRTGLKNAVLLPIAFDFATDIARPLLENIDAVHFTQMSRLLKVSEEYAARLLQRRYSNIIAAQFARHLTQNYSEHGFLIDAEEEERIRLSFRELGLGETVPLVETATPEMDEILDLLVPKLDELVAIGTLEKKT